MNSEVDLSPGRQKRLKTCTNGKYHDTGMDFSATKFYEITPKKLISTTSNAVDFSSPLSIQDGLDSGKFGSVAKDIQDLLARKMQAPDLCSKSFSRTKNLFLDMGKDQLKHGLKLANWQSTNSVRETVFIDLDGEFVANETPAKSIPIKTCNNRYLELANGESTHSVRDIVIFNLEDEFVANETPAKSIPAVIIDSDGEDMEDQAGEKPSYPCQDILTNQPNGETLLKYKEENSDVHVGFEDEGNHRVTKDGGLGDVCVEDATETKEDGCVHDQPAGETLLKYKEENREVHVGFEDEGNHRLTEDGGLGDVCVEDATETEEDGFVHEQPAGETLLKDKEENTDVHMGFEDEGNCLSNADTKDGGLEDVSVEDATETKEDECSFVGTEGEGNEISDDDDGLKELWKEMSMGLELSKVVSVNHSQNEQVREDGENCEHSFLLKDDLGYVCRICGVIDKGIESIFEFQYNKVKRSNRTYMPASWNSIDKALTGLGGLKLSDDDVMLKEVYAHPRHAKKMKPHQVEGFNFLVSNLVGDNPGGCILAHAPGSGKTFMIISFVQSFMAKYPDARPLVVLPKGILETWKKEFKIWQIEDILLYDFYSVKAESRFQQLDVLKQWAENKSILFLGYKQFSTIVCDLESSEVTNSCREILVKAPSILILDEGHTPRNDSTDVFQALVKVQTPRKVVLSGTLYQNSVKEVFNVLNLVRPKFLRTEAAQQIVKRIMSKVDVTLSSVRKNFKAGSDAAFYDLVEVTLQKDKDFRRKVSVINDLREMTSKVLHYYKGDFLDELPGLVDFTVVLHLSSCQKREVKKIKLQSKFKASSVGGAVYLHPKLQPLSDNRTVAGGEIDEVLENLKVEDGVKAKFFWNMLSLCDLKDEKLLVFSQYLTPLKFLERLTVKEKGWCHGREIFFVSGDSSQRDREQSMECFNNSPKAKVFFGSIKACGEGISLVGASRIIILDVHLNPSVTRQAIGRAFRPGQTKKVFVYRLVAADSPEVADYDTCLKKELISKTWFEWKEYCGYRDLEVKTVDVNECGDEFLEGNPILAKDVKVLYKR